MRRKKTKNNIKIIIPILAVIIIGIIIVTINIRKNINKTIETDGQAIEETNQEENIVEETNEIEETEPVDENIIDENEIKESKVTNEKQVKENQNKYYIKINNQANVVTIYTKDSQGNYTVPVKAMICSIGTATPTGGKYKLNGTKHKWHTLFGHTPGTYVYGQYTTAIVGNILFHSVPYTTKGDPTTLEYLEYDKLGTKASAGCIRLTVQDAAWIYNNITKGTIVEFYYDSNPGPLGKPSAQKISGDTERRGWDPTDPNPENPWHKKKDTSAPETTQNSQPSQDVTQNQGQNQVQNQEKENIQADKNDNQDNKEDNKNNQQKENDEDNKKDNQNKNKVEDNKVNNPTNNVTNNTTNTAANNAMSNSTKNTTNSKTDNTKNNMQNNKTNNNTLNSKNTL